MPRSLIRRRQEAERQRLEAYQASLRLVSAPARQRPDFEQALHDAKGAFGAEAIRPCADWHPKLKTRDPGRLRLAAARHLFARYTVPAHLEAIWLGSEGLDEGEIRLRKRWYIAAAKGESLYAVGASAWLTRKEVHWFTTFPGDLTFGQAFWLAVLRSFACDTAIALRVARSKISQTPRAHLSFWREVGRFLCAFEPALEEMNDIVDYLVERWAHDPGYSMRGRTLESLRRQIQDWHREDFLDQRARASLPDPTVRWPGSQLADWEWTANRLEQRRKHGERFIVEQLNSAEELIAESRAMHHCVWTYVAKCVNGHASIWGMRRREYGKVHRMLTIELDSQKRVVQIRGFGNRTQDADEQKILNEWALARGVRL